MATNSLRQSSLILGSGPGALTVLQDGTTVIVPGIDAWYVTRRAPLIQRVPEDVKINDPELAKNLGVDFFVLPPAKGISRENDADYLHVSLFPSWLICYGCSSLIKIEEPTPIKCPACKVIGKPSRKMVQTNFAIACEDGHLDEFPWVEWVHRGVNNICETPKLIFKAKGIVQLSSQRVICSCGKKRDLGGTSNANVDGSTDLSETLDSNARFTCGGARPWLRQKQSECSKDVRMVLRSSNNIYFSNTVSSILVPKSNGENSAARERIEASNQVKRYQAILLKNNYDYLKVAQGIKDFNEPEHYRGIDAVSLARALQEKFQQVKHEELANLEDQIKFDRTPEWNALNNVRESSELTVRSVGEFDGTRFGIKTLHAVPVLKKTTALMGFSRLKPNEISPARGRQLLRRDPFNANANWLPAIRQTGEGIFVSIDEALMSRWECHGEVQNRADVIKRNLDRNQRTLAGGEVSARFVLLHTFAHTLIQELVIECGYTSASLAERIYADEGQSGILIYTASASSDGTMGGLVEMSEPRTFFRSVEEAISRARWCSNDPVCMELGRSGQGNSGSNLAACHSCCLLPETACEYFNQGLDRAMLIGDPSSSTSIGFFDFIKD